MKTIKLLTVLLLIGGMFAFMSCEEDEEPGSLTVSSITATGTDLETGETVTKDLNAATAPTDVPIDAEVKITFNKDVDEATVAAANITISSANGDVNLNINVSGAEVTLSSENELDRGTEYTLSLAAGLQASDGGTFEAIERSFKTAGQGIVTPPQSDKQVAYFTFNNTLEDFTGNHSHGNIAQVTGYVKDRFGYVNSAAEFNGETDIVDVSNPGDMINPSTTISFWMKVDLSDPNYENGMFLMGATAEYGFFFELGKADFGPWIKVATRHKAHPDATGDFTSATAWGDAIKGEGADFGDVWEGDLGNLIDGKWVHFVLTYDHTNSMKRAYINATKVWENDLASSDEWKMQDMHIDTESPTDASADIGIGFAGSSDNHSTGWADYQTYVDDDVAKTFSGYMDDVRFFSTALSATEVQTLYDAEKPAK